MSSMRICLPRRLKSPISAPSSTSVTGIQTSLRDIVDVTRDLLAVREAPTWGLASRPDLGHEHLARRSNAHRRGAWLEAAL
jgi:hypothetical protein